jgi:hypothetical protein
MYKNATKCNETIGKWCKNKHGASKIIDTFETYQPAVGLGSYDPRSSQATTDVHRRYPWRMEPLLAQKPEVLPPGRCAIAEDLPRPHLGIHGWHRPKWLVPRWRW